MAKLSVQFREVLSGLVSEEQLDEIVKSLVSVVKSRDEEVISGDEPERPLTVAGVKVLLDETR